MNTDQLDVQYTLSKYNCVLKRSDIVLVCNLGYGSHAKLSAECWNVIEHNVSKYTPRQISSAADKDDQEYFENVFKLLIDKRILVSEEEGVERVYLKITHRCNLNCIHCCESANTILCNEHLSTSDWLEIIDKVLELTPVGLVITGGEPLVRDDFYEIAKYIRKKYTGKLELMTNGTLISYKNVDEIVEIFDYISLSIDGYDEATCSVIRGKGVFGKVLNTVKMLKSKGMDGESISISMVETSATEGKTEAFEELCRSLGVKSCVRQFNPLGRGKENESKLYIDKEMDERKWKEQLDRLIGNIPIPADNQVPFPCRGCKAGVGVLFVEDNGDIFPCQLLRQEGNCLGNALETGDLSNMIEDKICDGCDTLLRYEESLCYSECLKCDVRFFCKYCMACDYIKDGPGECNKKKEYLRYLVWGESDGFNLGD